MTIAQVSPFEYGPVRPTINQLVDAVNALIIASNVTWRYISNPTAHSGYPGNGDIDWDNATQINSANIGFSHKTFDSLDIDLFLGNVRQGNVLTIQDAANSGNFQTFNISGPPVNFNFNTPTSYWEMPVTFVTSGGTGTTNFAGGLLLFTAFFVGPT